MRKVRFIISLFSCLFLTACSFKAKTITYTKSPIYAMDTVISLSFYNLKDNNEYYSNVKKIYKDIDKEASDYNHIDTITSIYDLNSKREGDVSDSLLDLINKALYYKEITNGYFNPFIGSLSHLWKESLDDSLMPSENTINDLLEKMNNTSLEIDGNHIKIIGDGNLDLGAIAKGYATYKANNYLKENDIKYYLLNAGDSSIALGSKNNENLKIALLDPNSNKEKTSYIGVLSLKDKVISASSPLYQNKIIDGKKYHHLINPFTGYPANNFDGVFVINDNPLEGDVYSTAIFQMDLETAKEFALDKGISIILYKGNEIIYKSLGVSIEWKNLEMI